MKCLTVTILILIVLIYILIGGAIFYALESSNESTTRTTTFTYYNNFLSTYTCVSDTALQTFITTIITAYDQGILATNTSSSASQWDYGNSVFFAMTCVTTIGYGNQSPTTTGGRVFFIFYALIGIPITAVALAGLGTKISYLVKLLQKNIWIKNHPKVDKVLKSIFIITLGFLILLFVPAGIFSAVEGWTYGESIYYIVVSLTTVGFGDFVIGTEDKDYRVVYRLFVGLYLLFGLAWVAFTIGEASEYYKAYSAKLDAKIKEKNGKKDGSEVELQDNEKANSSEKTNGEVEKA